MSDDMEKTEGAPTARGEPSTAAQKGHGLIQAHLRLAWPAWLVLGVIVLSVLLWLVLNWGSFQLAARGGAEAEKPVSLCQEALERRERALLDIATGDDRGGLVYTELGEAGGDIARYCEDR